MHHDMPCDPNLVSCAFYNPYIHLSKIVNSKLHKCTSISIAVNDADATQQVVKKSRPALTSLSSYFRSMKKAHPGCSSAMGTAMSITCCMHEQTIRTSIQPILKLPNSYLFQLTDILFLLKRHFCLITFRDSLIPGSNPKQ